MQNKLGVCKVADVKIGFEVDLRQYFLWIGNDLFIFPWVSYESFNQGPSSNSHTEYWGDKIV